MDDQSSLHKMHSGENTGQRALPFFARRHLSRAAYQLLEACRAYASGTQGDTCYDKLTAASGLRSRASIAKALKELDALEVIDYRARRGDRGQVLGLWIQYRGLPAQTPEAARAAYIRAASQEYSALVAKMRSLEAEIKMHEAGYEAEKSSEH
jgi:hypothetical protein